METLVQIRNGLLQKFKKKRKLEVCSLVTSSDSDLKQTITSNGIRKGDLAVNRLILKRNVDKGQQPDCLKKLNKISEKQKIADVPKKQKNTSGSLKKRKNKSGTSESETLISLFKQQKKIHDLKKKLNTNSHVPECSKKQCKGFQGDQSLPSHAKEKDSGCLQNESLKKKRKLKKRSDKVVRDEASQLQRRARYLLVKLKLEQNLIDAYTAEGWKGQSREKLKPEKELQRAEEQILKCKLGIRDTVRQLDLLGSVGQIDDSFISADGSVHHEHIICKKCKSQEVSEDNDIILCDGTCKCAFHQKCIDPPLATEDIPPEDQGWLCKYCDCKMDLLDAVNAHLGTQFSDNCKWQDIFQEEALLSDAGAKVFNPEEEWPDDESEDNDYDPDRDEIYSTSWCDAKDDTGSHEGSSASSSSCSLESEVHWESGLSTESNEISSEILHLQQNCVTDANDNEIISGPRQRPAVNYKRLYDEMFAKDISNSDVFSEDEDWDPRKRRRRGKESDAASTLMTLCDSEVKLSDSKTQEVGKDHPPDKRARKPPSRMAYDVLKKLREAFSENELPSREVKKDISELVGLEYAKVNKWFKNARYLALKRRKREKSLPCTASKKSDNDVDKTVEPIGSKCSSPISFRKTQLKKVSWNDNLTTLLSFSKKKRFKRTSLVSTKANVERTNDMSLKKHLLNLRAKSRHKKEGICDTEYTAQGAETQMEQLYQIEAKIWKLKQVVSTFQKAINNDSNEQCLEEKQVVYVPIAEVREKA